MIKLCIFDLDGTVLDTLGSIAAFANGALREHGLPVIDEAEYRYFAGYGAKALIHNMLTYLGCDTEPLYERVYASYIRDYHADATVGARHFVGLPEVLERMSKRGVRLAIVSNKPDVAAKCAVGKMFREGLFSCVQGASDGLALKPDPTEVLRVMHRFGVAAEDCAYVGDTSTDIDTAKNAGVRAIGVLWGFRDRAELAAHGADALCETPEELCRVLLGKRS